MKAHKIVSRKSVWPDGTVVEAVIWKLPAPTPERPHALKYRLYCGRAGHCLVRYDNEIGKGDHMHYGEQQIPYQFVSRARLMADFVNDVKRLTGGKLGWKDF